MASRGARCVSTLVILIAGYRLPALATPSEYEGRPVSEIRYDPPYQPVSDAELNRLVGIAAGQPLSLAALRQAIQRLYSTGRYDEIRADAALSETGAVILTFQTVQNWFMSRISVEGVEEPPNREQLLSSTKLELGTRYSEDLMVEAIRGLRQTLTANGYHTPRIQPLVERYPEFDELHIQFLINPGPRAYFTRPVITGNLRRSEGAILRDTAWKRWWGLLGWKQFTETRLQRGLDRIRRAYLKRDYLLTKVEMEDLAIDREERLVEPRLHIEAGPRVQVRTTGTKVSQGRLKEMIPVYQEQSVDQDLLIEGMRKLTQHFQSKGYFDTQVSFQQEQISADEQLIEYAIDRGERYKLVHLEISGNRYFDALTVRERMAILPAGRFTNRAGRFSEELLERDKGAIEELYRANGFRDVRVSSRVEKNHKGKQQDIAVFVEVEEGEQWFVNSLDISGVDLRLYEYVQSILTSTEGQPYSAFSVATDRDNILNFYYDNGYPDASMEITSTPSDDPRRMNLRYAVSEGRRLFVKEVAINGLDTTRPSLVFNRISLEPNSPISLTSMVFSQRRLYDLGIFAKVDMATENPLGNTREKRVLFQFEEASRYSFNAGVGAEFGRFGGSATSLSAPAGGAAFTPRLSLGISRLNMFGVGHTLGAQGRFSTYQKRGLLTYLAPQFKGRDDLNLTLTALWDDSRNVLTFGSRRIEGALQVGQRLSRATSAQYRLIYRRVSTSDVKIEPGLIPLFSQPVRVGLVSATLVNDRRDDPLNATRGMYYSVDLAVANRAFLSDPSFGRLLGRNSSYHRVSRDYVVSRNTTFGWIYNYGKPQVPLPERFFAGGAVSHRGFPENQAGPRDLATGFPLGGRALLFNQTELRFPLAGNNLGGVLFHDAGNVYSRIQDMNFRYKQRDLTDFDYMVHALGFGVRYRTPIGPVRVDLAYGANSPRFFGYRGSLNDLLQGNLGSPISQRVSRFQFHFSLGQAF
ncbi:MAG: BamA/TamA family outer membrane protein [Bryobacteraceae bacterium]|nr:BamA/TamA family outer membrane protein [Bryobacteraceae bacterium]